ncbi:MAG: hypothetical protein P8Y69_08565, partial [Gammaproteobacteria bacterium]
FASSWQPHVAVHAAKDANAARLSVAAALALLGRCRLAVDHRIIRAVFRCSACSTPRLKQLRIPLNVITSSGGS